MVVFDKMNHDISTCSWRDWLSP